MHVFSFLIFEKCWRCRCPPSDILQTLQNGDQLTRGQDAGLFQGAGMGPAGLKFVAQQSPVKVERPLPALEGWVEGLPEAAGPHLHLATSDLAASMRARERE